MNKTEKSINGKYRHCLYFCSGRTSLKEVVHFPKRFKLQYFIYTGISKVMCMLIVHKISIRPFRGTQIILLLLIWSEQWWIINILSLDFRSKGWNEFTSDYFYVELRYLWRVLQVDTNNITLCWCWLEVDAEDSLLTVKVTTFKLVFLGNC